MSPSLATSLLFLLSGALLGCRSSEKPVWRGEPLDPVTSAQPLEGSPTEAEAELAAERAKAVQPAATSPTSAVTEGASSQGTSGTLASKEAQSGSGDQAELDDESIAFEIEKKVRESYHADLEMQIAEQKAISTEAKAALALRAAQAAQVAAVEAATQYEKVDSPRLVAAAQLKVDELRFKVEMAELELQQMEAEYGKFQGDSHAAETGKIVIWRETEGVGHAKRRMTLEVASKKTLEDYTIPRKKRELQLAVIQAQAAVLRAEEDQVRTQLEIKLSLRKAKDRQSVLKYELEKLRAKRVDS